MIIDSKVKTLYNSRYLGVHGSFYALASLGLTEKNGPRPKGDLSDADALLTLRHKRGTQVSRQGVTAIKDTKPVAELVATLKEKFIAALEQQYSYLKKYQ